MLHRPLRCLVTGATGFLGGNVVRSLLSRADVEVVAACRRPAELPFEFRGEVRSGDLSDPRYRRAVLEGIDVVCHAGTWAAMWGHEKEEVERFYDPTCDLIEQSVQSGVRRFILAATIAMAPPALEGSVVADDDRPQRTRFWPHLDRLIDVDAFMQSQRGRGTQMVVMRLGHFVGRDNRIGLVPALVPRLKTRLVPWLNGGRSRLPLIADLDLGESFALAATCQHLEDYESFNICGPEFPTMREVVELIAAETGIPSPHYDVPFSVGYSVAWWMEKLHPISRASSPFLTRSIVYLAENRPSSVSRAKDKLGYSPSMDWRIGVRESLDDLRDHGYPWWPLAQSHSLPAPE